MIKKICEPWIFFPALLFFAALASSLASADGEAAKDANPWYSASANVESDPELFRKQAEESLGRLSRRIVDLKERASLPDQKEKAVKNKNEIEKLEKQLEAAAKNFKKFKSAEEESAEAARGEFAKSFEELTKEMHDASSKILKDKEVYQWEARSKRYDRQYQIQQLQTAAAGARGDVQKNLDKQIAALSKKNKEIEAKILKVERAARKDVFENLKKETDGQIEGFDKDYEKAVKDYKESQGPVTYRSI